MTTETPAQRRTRLIEQYLCCQPIRYRVESLEDMKQILNNNMPEAELFADAVIAATPQVETEIERQREDMQLYIDRCKYATKPEPRHDSEQEVDELREHINDLEILLTDARANLEIERHRKTQPSKAETRLIELCERLIYRMSLPTHDYAVVDLAAIKRDIGIES